MAPLWAQALQRYGAEDPNTTDTLRLLQICSKLSSLVFARHLLLKELEDLKGLLGQLQRLIETKFRDTYFRMHKGHQIWHYYQCMTLWTGHIASVESHERLNKVK